MLSPPLNSNLGLIDVMWLALRALRVQHDLLKVQQH